jgi:hypothetical protein
LASNHFGGDVKHLPYRRPGTFTPAQMLLVGPPVRSRIITSPNRRAGFNACDP